MDHLLSMKSLMPLILIITGVAAILLSSVTGLKIKRLGSSLRSRGWLYFIMSLTYLIPFVFVAFISIFIPADSITFPPDLITGSIIAGGICIVITVFGLTKACMTIMQNKAAKSRRLKNNSRQYSLTDVLTGLYNRRGFTTHIEHHMRLAARDKKKVLFFYVRIDNLKNVEEKLGFQERDLMLAETARIVSKSFRKSDVVARVSEDKFMVFLIDAKETDIHAISDNFKKRFESYNTKRNKKYRLPVNFCVVHYDPSYNHQFDNIMAQADDFLRKKSGKNKEIAMCEISS